MADIVVIDEGVPVQVVETETETQVITREEVPTTVEVRHEGPQGPPSFEDAPSDGNIYGRKNGEWVVIG